MRKALLIAGMAYQVLALAACAAPASLPRAAINYGSQLAAQTPVAARLALSVRELLPAAYGLSYLDALDWDSCTITLTNTSPVVNLTSGSLTPTDTGGVRSANFVFNPITPAVGYTLVVVLSRGGQTIASGSLSSLALSPGPNFVNVPVALTNNNALSVQPALVTNDMTTANVATYGYDTIGSPALPRFNGSTVGDTALGDYQEVSGIDSDNQGNVYVSDAKEARIVAIPGTGATPTRLLGVAGVNGYTADGPVAATTTLNVPRGLVHEASSTGRLFFCEFGTGTADGRIRTLIGGNLGTYAGGGVGAAGQSGADALALQLNGPSGLCSDTLGNLFFTETGLGLVRRILTGTRVISTVSTPGGANAGNFGPCCLDTGNNVLYYAVGNTVYSVTTPAATPGTPHTVVTLTAAQLGLLVNPTVTVTGLSLDGNGLLYAAVASSTSAAFDSDAKVVRIPVDATGALIGTAGRSVDVVAGNGATLAGNSNDVAASVVDATTQNLGGAMNNLAIDTHASNVGGVASGTLYFGNTSAVGPSFTYAAGTNPWGVAIDSTGNVWIADKNAVGTVSRLSPTGVLLGTYGVGNAPQGVAIDGAGNVWVANSGDNTVSKLSAAGASLGTFGVGSSPQSVAIDPLGNVWVANGGSNNATKLSSAGVAIGTYAVGSGPMGIAVDTAGAAWVVNQNDATVTKLSSAGVVQGTFGTGAAPQGVAIDGLGNVWVTNRSDATVTELSSVGAYEGTFAVSPYPVGVAIDPVNNVWVVGATLATKLSQTGAILGTFAVGSSAEGIAVDAQENAWATGTGPNTVTKIEPGYAEVLQLVPPAVVTAHYGTIVTTVGTGVSGSGGDGGPASAAQLASPVNAAFDASGNMYIADSANNKIRKISASGIISTFAGTGVAGAAGDGGPATSAQLDDPYGVAVDATGNVYIGDSSNNEIRIVNLGGTITTFAGSTTAGYAGDGGPATSAKLHFPQGVTVDAAGDVYIADSNNNAVRKVSPGHVITTYAGTGTAGSTGNGGPAASAKLGYPVSVAVDAVGNLYVADAANDEIRKVNLAGTISTIAGIAGSGGSSGDGGPAIAAKLNYPQGVVVDAQGNVFIADYFNCKIREVNVVGTISTIAGSGASGYLGDGGSALSAQINLPTGLAFDAAGSLYLMDLVDNRVRKVF